MVVFKINKLLVVLLVAVGWFWFGGLQVVWAEPQFGGVVEELIECDCTNNTYIRVGDPHGGDLGTEGEYIKNSSTKPYDCEPLIQGEWILGMHTENMEDCEIRVHGACVKIHEGKVIDFYGSDNCPGAMGASSSGGGGGVGGSSSTDSSSSSHSSHGSSSSSSSGSSANNSSSHSSHSSIGHSTSNNSSGQVTHNSSGNRSSDENNSGNSNHSGNNQSGGQNILDNNVTNHDTNSSERDNHQQVTGGNNSLSNNITNNDSANSALSTSVVSQGEQLEDKNILWKQILAGFSFAMAGFFVWRAGMKLMNG